MTRLVLNGTENVFKADRRCREPAAKRASTRAWKEEMLTFHTHTLTFLSSYDISSLPKMIQLITGFIVSRLKQFINWLCSNTDSLFTVGASRRCKTLSSFTERGRPREGDGRQTKRLFWLSKSDGCVAHLHVHFCMFKIALIWKWWIRSVRRCHRNSFL